MKAFEAEDLKQKVQKLILESSSSRKKLIILKDFYDKLIFEFPSIICAAYINEFRDELISVCSKFEVFYFNPEFTRDILKLLLIIKQNQKELKTVNEINSLISSFESKLSNLNQILNGYKIPELTQRKIFFPILEKPNNEEFDYNIGTLETFSIDIKKSNVKDNFIIIPSEELIDESLQRQIKISWNIAKTFLNKNLTKIGKYHKVIIQFDHRYGNYSGSSLGTALAISFIEELIKLYNLSCLISVKENIALTGGFDENGRLVPLNENIMNKKVEITFYSVINILIVPDENKTTAVKRLEFFKKLYPSRDLQIIGINDLQDLLDRRNLIDIKMQNPIIRSINYGKKNWVVSLLVILLLMLSFYFYQINFDDLPSILHRDGQTLFIENKSGKVLFTKSFAYNNNITNPWFLKNFQLLVDINNDKKKELITSNELLESQENETKSGGIICYDYKGNKIWSYLFSDTISTPGETLSANYESFIVDTSSIKNQKVLVAFSQNEDSFGSAIYMISLTTGKRVFDTFWHPGLIIGGHILQNNGSNVKNLIFCAKNNVFHKLAVGTINIDDCDGQAPSNKYYNYSGKKNIKIKDYILLPNEDYEEIINPNESLFCGIGDLSFEKKRNAINCKIYLNARKNGEITYSISKDFKKVKLKISDEYARIRDPFVKWGILKPYLSKSLEYKNFLLSQILYWNGKNFVKRGLSE